MRVKRGIWGVGLCVGAIVQAHESPLVAFEEKLFQEFKIAVQLSDNWIARLNEIAEQQVSGHRKFCADAHELGAAYPQLAQAVPYIALGTLPTPVMKLATISDLLGCPVYIKRDDMSGAQGLYGGNKVRKLEFLFAQALACGARKVMTFGAAGSNHAVATAMYAKLLGLDPIGILCDQLPTPLVERNLLTHVHCGTELHMGSGKSLDLLAFMCWLDHYKKDGHFPYIIPVGGSNIFGTLGFVNAVFELHKQIKAGLLPEPTRIYVPCGTGATVAGILLGLKAVGLRSKVLAISIEPNTQDPDTQISKIVEQLFTQTNEYLCTLDRTFPRCSYTSEDIEFVFQFSGPEYASITQEATDAQDIMWKHEHITLDTTYSAKAFAALLTDLLKKIKKQPCFGIRITVLICLRT